MYLYLFILTKVYTVAHEAHGIYELVSGTERSDTMKHIRRTIGRLEVRFVGLLYPQRIDASVRLGVRHGEDERIARSPETHRESELRGAQGTIDKHAVRTSNRNR